MWAKFFLLESWHVNLAIFNLALARHCMLWAGMEQSASHALPERSDLTCNTLLIPVLSGDSRRTGCGRHRLQAAWCKHGGSWTRKHSAWLTRAKNMRRQSPQVQVPAGLFHWVLEWITWPPHAWSQCSWNLRKKIGHPLKTKSCFWDKACPSLHPHMLRD